jgi:hypothetical protein
MEREQPHPIIWLLLPWLTAVAMGEAFAAGVDGWIMRILPHDLGRMPVQNAGWGILLVTLLSSARWAHLHNRVRNPKGDLPTSAIICWAILITIAQACVALGIFAVGWVISSSL